WSTHRVEGHNGLLQRMKRLRFIQAIGAGTDQLPLEDLTKRGIQAAGTFEDQQAMAAHERLRTTKLYDHTGDEITLDAIERITIFLRGAALTKQGAFEEAVAWPTRGPRRPPRCRLAAALRSG